MKRALREGIPRAMRRSAPVDTVPGTGVRS